MTFDSVMLWFREYGLFLFLVCAAITTILFFVRRSIPDQKESSFNKKHNFLVDESEIDIQETKEEDSGLPVIPQEAFDFYDKNRELILNPDKKPNNGFTKTEQLIFWLLKNNKVFI